MSQAKVERILYKEIVEGDLRKLRAESNDSPTGGGARDFRFGSFKQLQPVIRKMFPRTVQEKRKRNNVNINIDVFEGMFYWKCKNTGQIIKKASYFEPPTDARPQEGRIVRVHEYECLDTSLIPQHGVGNCILLLLIQLTDGSVWPYYAEERSIRTPGLWDPVVAQTLISCIDAKRPSNRAVIGYRDFTAIRSYCNGK